MSVEVGKTRMREKHRDDMEDVFLREAPRLWRALFAYCGDPEISSDAVSEAFAQLLGREAEVTMPNRWVWRAAFKIAGGELKRRGRSEPLRSDVSEVVDAVPEPLTDLLEALDGLTHKQRAATILHYYGGYSTREIADILGSSAATVRVHLSQGRKRLRATLGGSDG